MGQSGDRILSSHITKIVINQIISYWPNYRFLVQYSRPGTYNRPIQYNLINNIMHYVLFVLLLYIPVNSNFILAELQVLGLLYWPVANTADLEPITGPIHNNLINSIMYFVLFVLLLYITVNNFSVMSEYFESFLD